MSSERPARPGEDDAPKDEILRNGIPGKLTCYVELSGVPLPALNMLGTGGTAITKRGRKYRCIRTGTRLFSSSDGAEFRRLDRLAEDFKLYLQGVLLGC